MQAWVAVNLTANLQDSFTWNTRQIYLWLTAEYRTEKNQLNQAVFWNWIIESKVGFAYGTDIIKQCNMKMLHTDLCSLTLPLASPRGSANTYYKIHNHMAIYRRTLFQLHSSLCQVAWTCFPTLLLFYWKVFQLLSTAIPKLQHVAMCRRMQISEYHGSLTRIHPVYQSTH